MLWRDFRSVLSGFLRHCRRVRDAAWRWAGTGHGWDVHSRAGGQRLRRFLESAGELSSSSDRAFSGGRRAARCTLPDRDPRQPLVDYSSCGMPAGGGDGPHGETARSGYDPQQLRVPDGHLVLADGNPTGTRNRGTQATAGERHFRRRLEVFFHAASIADPIATTARLSAHFASLSELLSADPVIVADYSDEIAAAALSGVRDLMTWALEEELRERETIHSACDASALLKHLIGFRCDELLVVLFLDSGRGLIDHEIVAAGRVSSVDVDCRRILLRAIGRGAAGIIMAHNHPSGDPRPSSSDIRATRLLADGARAFEITLHDHLIFARIGIFSFRQEGLL